jgi:hypothetical protein
MNDDDDELRKCGIYICNGILLSHKEERILSFTGKLMKLKNIILNEVSQTQKAKSRMFSLICVI